MNTIKNPSKRLARWVEEFQNWNLIIKYRPGTLATVPDALSRRPDYLNAIMLGGEEYIPHLYDFIKHGILPDDEELQTLIIEQHRNFALVGHEPGAKHKLPAAIHRKIREGVTAPYIEFEFRGDLMQKLHNQYGHLSYDTLIGIFETRAWWPTMEKDIRTFIAACPNCQVHQRQ